MAPAQVNRNTAPEANAASRRIVAAARRQFFTHGFRRFTMDDLAGELGMSKKTLYACFPSKAALLQAVILDKFADVEAGLEQISTRRTLDFMDSMQQLLACIQHNAEEVRPPFLRDVEREAPELFKLAESRRREVIQRHFKRLFNHGRKSGMIRTDIPAAVMIEILLGATQALVHPQQMSLLHLTPKAALLAALRVVLEGVIVRSGRPQS